VHVQSLLGDRRESRPARRVADLSLELHPLGFECLTFPVELAQGARLVDPIRSSCNDARSHEDETKKCERDGGASR
jgi:hypothetical protein